MEQPIISDQHPLPVPPEANARKRSDYFTLGAFGASAVGAAFEHDRSLMEEPSKDPRERILQRQEERRAGESKRIALMNDKRTLSELGGYDRQKAISTLGLGRMPEALRRAANGGIEDERSDSALYDRVQTASDGTLVNVLQWYTERRFTEQAEYDANLAAADKKMFVDRLQKVLDADPTLPFQDLADTAAKRLAKTSVRLDDGFNTSLVGTVHARMGHRGEAAVIELGPENRLSVLPHEFAHVLEGEDDENHYQPSGLERVFERGSSVGGMLTEAMAEVLGRSLNKGDFKDDDPRTWPYNGDLYQKYRELMYTLRTGGSKQIDLGRLFVGAYVENRQGPPDGSSLVEQLRRELEESFGSEVIRELESSKVDPRNLALGELEASRMCRLLKGEISTLAQEQPKPKQGVARRLLAKMRGVR